MLLQLLYGCLQLIKPRNHSIRDKTEALGCRIWSSAVRLRASPPAVARSGCPPCPLPTSSKEHTPVSQAKDVPDHGHDAGRACVVRAAVQPHFTVATFQPQDLNMGVAGWRDARCYPLVQLLMRYPRIACVTYGSSKLCPPHSCRSHAACSCPSPPLRGTQYSHGCA